MFPRLREFTGESGPRFTESRAFLYADERTGCSVKDADASICVCTDRCRCGGRRGREKTVQRLRSYALPRKIVPGFPFGLSQNGAKKIEQCCPGNYP